MTRLGQWQMNLLLLLRPKAEAGVLRRNTQPFEMRTKMTSLLTESSMCGLMIQEWKWLGPLLIHSYPIESNNIVRIFQLITKLNLPVKPANKIQFNWGHQNIYALWYVKDCNAITFDIPITRDPWIYFWIIRNFSRKYSAIVYKCWCWNYV